MTTKTKHQHLLTLDNINPNVKKMEHPIRGPLLTRIRELENELKNGVKKPFREIIKPIIADCHAMGQPPITFIRQLVSIVVYPQLLDDPKFPDDAKERARTILKACNGSSVGSYTDTKGIEIIRKHVAEFIKNRDRIPCNWEDVVLCAGASDGVKKVLRLFAKETNEIKAGIMIPIPQYPLFSVLSNELGLHQIQYYLDESQNWRINVEELQRSIDEAKKVCIPKVLVIINPGNPTGQVLTKENIKEIIKFAYEENLYLLADEVYQNNIYTKEFEFHSFKKVITEMGKPYNSMDLASFMSCSKGYASECGFRGGFIEIINMCPKVNAIFHKANSATSCPPTTGQACVEATVRFPEKGEPSYELFIKEKEDILNSLKARAKLIVETLNSFEGVTCNELQGAMHLFPRIRFPSKAIEAAKKRNQTPDELYTSEALETVGVSIVAGEAFGQVPGTYHFRITLLPIDKMKIMFKRLQVFHEKFMDGYR